MADRFLCIHGHFYQPPRENPWLEDVEVQDSAFPFHDWNQRVHEECYLPNTSSRLLDAEGRITEIVNNYSKISFNFGPTLLSWMVGHDPATYQAILEADRASAAARGGHGNALAQVYNHVIMPLANRRDKLTQIVWGIRDFQKRFGRMPEGMWLAETAVDSETLRLLAENGIKFTLLSPYQAARIRPLKGNADWQDVAGGRIDPRRPYRWIDADGVSIDIFFYDGPVSQAIAFEGLLSNGEGFAARLLGAFGDTKGLKAPLVHVATDGETYGHHHRFGDMALAYALRKIEREKPATLTNYGEYLAKFPPEFRVEIVENSSWSCAHGVERWRADCGCTVGGHPAWNQAWRAPLRESLNWLRDSIDRLYEAKAGILLKNPWDARNDYIDVMFDRNREAVLAFFEKHQTRALTDGERVEALKLLEMQRHAQFMFTSCGWFFDEISGVEGVTVLQFAARVVQLSQDFLEGASLEKAFLERLSAAKSNIPSMNHGGSVYIRHVYPNITTLARVAAHHAIRGLFADEPSEGRSYCYRYQHLDRQQESTGASSFSVGRLKITSLVTWECLETAYAVIHVGGHDIQCVLRRDADENFYNGLKEEILDKFAEGRLTDVLKIFGQSFEPGAFSLQDLFLEVRRDILSSIIRETLSRYDGTYRHLVEENRKLMMYLKESNFPIPQAFKLALQYVLDRDLEKTLPALADDPRASQRLRDIYLEADRFGIPLDAAPVEEAVRRAVNTLMESLRAKPLPASAERILQLMDLADDLELRVFLWAAENILYRLWNNGLRGGLDLSKPDAPEVQPFLRLAGRFKLAVS